MDRDFHHQGREALVREAEGDEATGAEDSTGRGHDIDRQMSVMSDHNRVMPDHTHLSATHTSNVIDTTGVTATQTRRAVNHIGVAPDRMSMSISQMSVAHRHTGVIPDRTDVTSHHTHLIGSAIDARVHGALTQASMTVMPASVELQGKHVNAVLVRVTPDARRGVRSRVAAPPRK
ncbi:MAG TPA: hypothetical protein VEK57_03840 [Thermoanaerobaculia bacterium]|nr:hypothetical protein [Thermoanaerobaculia bacterium]